MTALQRHRNARNCYAEELSNCYEDHTGYQPRRTRDRHDRGDRRFPPEETAYRRLAYAARKGDYRAKDIVTVLASMRASPDEATETAACHYTGRSSREKPDSWRKARAGTMRPRRSSRNSSGSPPAWSDVSAAEAGPPAQA